MKQSVGTYFFVAIVVYLACRLIRRPTGWRNVAAAATAVTIGYCAGVGSVLTFLWTLGAFHDWYLQTIAFPRAFYFVSAPGQRQQR